MGRSSAASRTRPCKATNIGSDLLARNPALVNAGGIDKNWDFNPGFGGPIKQDKLWFFASGRYQGANLFAPGMFYNQNANNPAKWDYVADTSRPAKIEKVWKDAQLRLSWQAAPKHKIGVTYTQQDFCACHDAVSATVAPEAANDRRFPTQRVVLLDWTSPVTNRVLIEASGIHRVERWGNMHLQTKGLTLDPQMIGVVEQGGAIPGLRYRGAVESTARAGGTYNNSWNSNFHWRFHVSYITGSHAFKVGVNDAYGYHENQNYVPNPVSYRFNNGVPNEIVLRALPHTVINHVDSDLGLFAQDKWTIDRLTVSGGIRYDHHANTFPEQVLGPTYATPTRNITFPEQKNLELSRHHAKEPGGVRPVREREDGAQSQSEQVPGRAGDHQRRHHRDAGPQSDQRAQHRRQAQLDRRQQQQGARLRPAEPAGTGQSRQRRRLLLGVRRCDLRAGHAERAVRSGPADEGGANVSTTGSSRPGYSTKSCLVSRWMSATSGAGTATSSPSIT